MRRSRLSDDATSIWVSSNSNSTGREQNEMGNSVNEECIQGIQKRYIFYNFIETLNERKVEVSANKTKAV